MNFWTTIKMRRKEVLLQVSSLGAKKPFNIGLTCVSLEFEIYAVYYRGTQNRIETMSDTRKFKRKVKQSNPTNPSGGSDIKNKTFDIDKKTIDENQSNK
jgi:hypothetical protein